MKAVRKLLPALLLTLSLVSLRAQNAALELSRVSSEALVAFLEKEFHADIYFRKDATDVATYTVSAPREAFLERALEELRAKGYAVSRYDGKIFITSQPGFSVQLPPNYFEEIKAAEPAPEDDIQLQYVTGETTVVSFQNKIYEIGEKKEGKTGRVYINGYVRDVSSGEPVVGVAVYDGNSFATTDAAGHYRIPMNIGEGNLNFSAYGMEDMHLSVIVYDAGNLDVVMKEKVTALTGAVVSAESVSSHRTATLGLERITMTTMRKIPTAFGEADVIKVVMALPGVKSTGEAATGFNVRGGATDQNLILFNDGTIFNPSHMFGILSAFNPDVISEIELYKSSIPTEFGGRISSVLDIHGKEGNANKVTGAVGIGLLTSNLTLEGPIAKGRTTFVLGGRTTYSNWLLGLLPKDSGYSGGRASFYDVNASITHKANDRNTIQAFFYTAADKFSFAQDTTFRYNNLNASLKWRSILGPGTTMSLTGGYDSFGNQSNSRYYNNRRQVNTEVTQAFVKMNFKSTAGEAHTLSYGADGIRYDLNPGTLYEQYIVMDANGGFSDFLSPSDMARTTELDRQQAFQFALYISDSWKPGERFSLDAGVRGAAFLPQGASKPWINPEVRVSGKYSFAENFSVKAGFNSMTQYIHMISNTTTVSPMDTWQLSSDRIKPQTGWQGAGGLYWTVADNKVELTLEGYLKRMYHYLDYKSGAQLVMNPNLPDWLVETTGKAWGVEFMARKNVGKLNGWISYTYARTFLREMEDRGVETINSGHWYKAAHDKPHDAKAVLNYQFTHRYSISLNAEYSTGRPITLPMGKYYYQGGYRLAYSERNAYRIPDYFRLDAALIIEPGHYLKKLTHMSFTMGVYNITGRKNPYSVYYTAKGNYISGHMLCVFASPIPYLNLNLKF